MSGEILINQLFAGSYLDEGENIGHEIINLFEADDGGNYLYITPSGKVDRDVDSVLFVRKVTGKNQKTAEVIALAKGVEKAPSEKLENLHDVTYGGVPLPSIFKGNVWNSEQDYNSNVTYVAEEVALPAAKGRLLITLDELQDESSQVVKLDSSRLKQILNQSQRTFFSPEDDKVAYDQLTALISDPDNWVSGEQARKSRELVADGESAGRSPSFLEVIRRENDELTFSNLLAYYFDYSHSEFTAFASEVLGIDDLEASFAVMREHLHVDIYVKSEKYAIIVENKIRSGINGVRKDGTTQLDAYKEAVGQESPDAAQRRYVFAPDYAVDAFTPYASGSGYEVVPYSRIYKFFVRHTPAFIADHCFPDFLRGLKRHTVSTTAELNLETMRLRFLERIRHSIS